MAKIRENAILPYHWIDAMCTDIDGNYDEELGKNILFYFAKSAKEIALGGTQEKSGNPFVDVAVKGYLDQLEVMQNKALDTYGGSKKGSLTSAEIDEIVYSEACKGAAARQIRELLNNEYGCSYKDDSTIQKKRGWKRAHGKL